MKLGEAIAAAGLIATVAIAAAVILTSDTGHTVRTERVYVNRNIDDEITNVTTTFVSNGIPNTVRKSTIHRTTNAPRRTFVKDEIEDFGPCLTKPIIPASVVSKKPSHGKAPSDNLNNPVYYLPGLKEYSKPQPHLPIVRPSGQNQSRGEGPMILQGTKLRGEGPLVDKKRV